MTWLTAVVLLVLIFFTFVRPWYYRWGATRLEVASALPGDDLVPRPRMASTRAVTIAAPVEQVWPWLVQVGYQRAGWYNFDWINAALGAGDYVDGHRSADRIIPELQDVKVGDVIKLAPVAGWTVMEVEPERVLVFLARLDFTTGQSFALTDPPPATYLDSSQVLVLRKVDDETTRLLVRDRLDFGMGAWTFVTWLLEPGFFIQESAFMRGVKKRAEASR